MANHMQHSEKHLLVIEREDTVPDVEWVDGRFDFIQRILQ